MLVDRDDEATSGTEERERSAEMSARSILVVEDSRSQAKALTRVLHDQGLAVRVAGDGVEALAALGEERFDLVLSDVQMPRMGGYELCRRIKADPSTRDLPVILLTGLDTPQDVLEGLASGANSFVSKPFDVAVLLHRIEAKLAAPPPRSASDPTGYPTLDAGLPISLDPGHALEYLSATFADFVRSRANERRATAEAQSLRQSEQFLQAVLDGVSSCVGIVEASGELVATNQEWRTFDGANPMVGPELGPGFDFLELCRQWAPEHRCARTLAEDLPRLLSGALDQTSVECKAHCTDNWRCFRVRARRLPTAGPPRVVMSFHDVTELKLAEARLQHEAYHDALTGLPNRALFLERLERALSRSRRAGTRVAVLFCDLDRFKLVNDSLGHSAGDELLVEVAARLGRALREEDSVARFGGDEFAILLEGHGDEAAVYRITQRLQDLVSRPMQLQGQEVFTTLSVGIAIGGGSGATSQDLIRDADTAMYRAKEAGKARFVVFDADMHARSLAQLQLQNDLRRAIPARELFLLYQPILDLQSRAVVGVEALVRWQHPERGVVPPVEFIPVAEDSGLIQPIGLFVLREACAQIARWREARGGSFPFRVHVNLSGRQLTGDGFVRAVRETLLEFQLPADALEFELTESVVLTTGEDVANSVRALRDLGAGLAMDDFGTGFSSLSALRQLPFTTLKLDRSFVGTMDVDPRNLAIVRSLVDLGKGMGLDVVAEGVERPHQTALLTEMGCGLAQGYLFARPLSAEDSGALLGERIEGDLEGG